MNNITIIIVQPQQPDNVAAIARIMASFGFQELILINPLMNIKDIRPEISRGGTRIIDNIQVYDNLSEVRKHHDLLIGTTAKQSLGRNYGKEHIRLEELEAIAKKNNGRIGIVFGREDRGLTNEELGLCDLSLRIETSEEQNALNLSHAAAIILHSISKAKTERNTETISIEDKERIIEKIRMIYEQASRKNNTYITKRERTHLIVWRRILSNPMLNDMHAKAILGLLNEISKGLEENNKRD